jgi:hypothetical protein
MIIKLFKPRVIVHGKIEINLKFWIKDSDYLVSKDIIVIALL